MTEPTPDALVAGSLGLERRGLVPAALVALVVLVYAAGLPLVDALIDSRGAVVPAGTEMIVRAGPTAISSRVSFVPASGWEIGGETARSRRLTRDGVSFRITVDPGSAPPAVVVRRAERSLGVRFTGLSFHAPQSFATSAGAVGVTASFVGTGLTGSVFGLTDHRTAVAIVVIAPAGALLGPTAAAVEGMARTVAIR